MTRRSERRARVLRNRTARRFAFFLRQGARSSALNLAACPFHDVGSTWKFAEDDSIIEDGVSALGLLTRVEKEYTARRERDNLRRETLAELRACWGTARGLRLQRRIASRYEGFVYLTHCQTFVPFADIRARLR